MTEQERKTMLMIAKRLGELEKEVKILKGDKPIKTPALYQEEKKSSVAADKFFGNKTKADCLVEVMFKDGVLKPPAVMQEIGQAQNMLKQAVKELCEQFDIQEFKLEYQDPTPSKKKNV